jgi:hypothetical protein
MLHSKGMKTLIKLCRATLLLLSASLAADVWELTGNWVYRFKAREGSFSIYENKSYSIGVERALSDGTVIGRIEARLEPFYRGVPLAECVGRDGKPVSYAERSFYARDEEKRQRFLAEAKRLIGEHETVESAVEAIAFWVRANVYYQLDTANDPLGVLKAKKAYCEGYANLMVEFLLAYGIDARSLSCYIPAGKGWGEGGRGSSGGAGGYHAFVEYWYPGYGGVMCDPQSTLNYVDPYHILGFSRETKEFQGDIGEEVTKGYITGLRKGLVSWNTFSMSAQTFARGFVSTNFVNGAGALEPASIAACSADGASSEWLAAELLKKRSLASLHSSNELFYSKQLRFPAAAQGSYVLRPEGADGGEASARALCAGTSTLYATHINFGNPGYIEDLARPYEDPGALRAVFLDQNGFPLVAAKVQVEIDGARHALTTDKAGSLLIALPWESLGFTVSGARFEASPGASGTQRFALVAQGSATDKPAASPSPRPLGSSDLAILAIDPLGNANPSWFDAVDLYSASGKKAQGKKDPSGRWLFASALDKKPSSYVVVAKAGNRYLRRQFEHESGPLALELRDGLEAGLALESEFPRSERDSFYELWEAAQIAYQGATPRVLGMPSGFWLSDDAKGRYPHRFTLEEGATGVLYKRYAYTHDEYVEMRRRGQKDPVWLSGSITGYKSTSLSVGEFTFTFTGKERMKSGSLVLYDTDDFSSRKISIDEFGYFYLQGLKPGNYLALFYDKQNVIVDRIQIKEGENRLELGVVDRPVFTISSYVKELYLALPKKGKQGPEADFVCVGGKLSYYNTPSFNLPEGQWWIGEAPCYGSMNPVTVLADGSIEGAKKKDDGSYSIELRSGEISAEDAARLVSAFSLNEASGSQAFLVRVVRSYGTLLRNANFTISYDEKGEYKGTIDEGGLGFVRIPERESFTLRIVCKGIYILKKIKREEVASGLLTIDLRKCAASFQFSRKPSLTLLRPVPTKAQGFDWIKEKCEFMYNELLVVSDEPRLYFDSPEGTGVKGFDNLVGKTQAIGFAAMPDQYQLKKEVLFQLYKDRPLVVARFTIPAGPLASLKASFTQGSQTIQRTTSKEGLLSFINPFSEEPIKLECKAEGFFARKGIAISKKAGPLELPLDAVKLANITVSVSGLAKGKSASMSLYPGAKLEKGKLANSKEKIGLSTDSSGRLLLALEPGDYVIEYGKELKAFVAGAKAASIAFTAPK